MHMRQRSETVSQEGGSRDDCNGYSKYRARDSGRVVGNVGVGAASATGLGWVVGERKQKGCDNENGFANEECGREKVIGAQDAMV
jgi:hypothetical protein